MPSKVRTPTRAPRGVEIHMDAEKMHALFDSAGASLDYGSKYEVEAVLSGGHVVTLSTGTLVVTKDIPAVV